MDSNSHIVFKEIRQNQILTILRDKKSVSVNYLVENLFSSLATIRRDLDVLEKNGLIKRVHGGAILIDSTSVEATQDVREFENSEKKIIIAHLLEQFIDSNKSIFIDGSTTCRFVLPLLKRFSNNTYVTNSIKTAQSLISNNVDAAIELAGGTIFHSTTSTYGVRTVNFLSNFNTDISIIACRGVSSKNGCSVVTTDQGVVKQTMIKHSSTSFLLCDSTKFETTFLVKFADFSDFDYFITDKMPDSDLFNAITNSGCKIITPQT